ncbi:MAG: triose-phosphate isomerase [Candidatus Doudnabacteria bacterium]|nr:triose-phosphate isomerase [Candidatus Doudnabacteria bacterium]
MKKLIIANWKLNPTNLKDAQKLAASISVKAKNKVILCPPTIYLASINFPNIGAQDCFWADKGTYTGQTSPAQLKDLGVEYSLVGHSERREVGDTDEMVNLKVKACLANKITPVLCVGFGTKVEQDDLEVTDVLKSQLDINLAGVDASKVVVAYEPVWAISKGNPYMTRAADAEHAEKMAIFIKNKYKVSKVIYGASVNLNNAKGFLSQPNIDGLLPGGVSLISKDFNQIINF